MSATPLQETVEIAVKQAREAGDFNATELAETLLEAASQEDTYDCAVRGMLSLIDSVNCNFRPPVRLGATRSAKCARVARDLLAGLYDTASGLKPLGEFTKGDCVWAHDNYAQRAASFNIRAGQMHQLELLLKKNNKLSVKDLPLADVEAIMEAKS